MYIIFLAALIFSGYTMEGPPQPEIDEYDQISVDHSHIVFHMYAQTCNGQEINLKREAVTHHGIGPLSVSITRNGISDDLIGDWEFHPLYGITGIRCLGDWGSTRSLVGMLAYSPSKNLFTLSYRGSQQLSDWTTNFNWGVKELLYGGQVFSVHAGYADVFESSREDLVRHLVAIKTKIPSERLSETRLIGTGHSMGGAVSKIAVAFLIHNELVPHTELRIFGTPPISYNDFGDWLTAKTDVFKSFYRETDMAYVNPPCYGYPLPGRLIKLPHFGDPWYLFFQAHDVRKYRRAISQRALSESHLGKQDDTPEGRHLVVPLFNYTVSLFWATLPFR